MNTAAEKASAEKETILRENASPGKRRSDVKIMTKLLTLVKPLLHYMLAAILLGVAGYLCAWGLTLLGTKGILEVLGAGPSASLKSILVPLILCGVLRGPLRYGEQACNHYIAFRLLAVIRDKVFGALRRLGPAKLEGRSKGDLVSLITSDVELLEVFYAHTVSPVAIGVITSAAMALFIGGIHPLLGLLAAAGYIFVGAVLPAFNGERVKDPGMEYRRQSGKLNGVFLESLRGMKELLQYGRANERLNEIREKTDLLGALQEKLRGAEAKTQGAADFAILLFNGVMLFASYQLYMGGSLSFGDSLLAAAALMSSFGPSAALSGLSNSLSQTLAAGERVLSILEEAPAVEEKTGGRDISFDGLCCRGVSFGYGDAEVLKGLSMEIPKGEITGILGKSGCGKSTLLKLFMRFWDKREGRICFSGTEIQDINTRSLRENESYCTKETQLFNDTIGNNIRLARLGATDAEVAEAARKASLHDFITSLPLGYDTPIGELGDRLSGGEKQRISIARAFLSPAPLMLLDEPTSNLDSLNEGIILKSLYESENEKTVVLVSHRSSTLGIASRVYSMENGNAEKRR